VPMHAAAPSAVSRLAAAAALVVLAGCGILAGLRAPPAPAGWTREEVRERSSRCWSERCRISLTAPDGRLHVRGEFRSYAPHQIPGWDGRSWPVRALSTVAEDLLRTSSAPVHRLRIGLATLEVTGDAAAGWRMSCSVLRIDEEELEGRFEERRVVRGHVLARGLECDGSHGVDPQPPVWRIRAGPAPARDSLAAAYAWLISGEPAGPPEPMFVERTGPEGELATRLRVVREPGGLRFFDDSGAPRAHLTVREHARLDLDPSLPTDERVILRLLAAALQAASSQRTGP
jgi:hypothetical protein